MNDAAPHGDGHDTEVHHRKPRHLAEKMESYLVMAMGIGGAILLAVLIYSFMQTGTGTPSWMK